MNDNSIHFQPRIRRPARAINLGRLKIGGHYPVRVQSMTNTDTRNTQATLAQIEALTAAGCEFIRVAVPDKEAAGRLSEIKNYSKVPLVADVHFDYRLALQAIEAGMDGLRINPGNIGSKHKVEQIIAAARSHGTSIRIGVNSGSVEKRLLKKYSGPTPEAMVESAIDHLRHFEDNSFTQIKISIKSSSVLDTIRAYQLLADKTKYPLHIGVTEAGSVLRGSVKSSVGLGILLWQGIGDTLRVSLTGDPLQEVLVCWEILRSLGLRHRGPDIISCPTCGRTEMDVESMTQEIERRLQTVQEVFTVAVMGCAVNGPGEAREADIGIAGGKDCALIFRKGLVKRKIYGREYYLPEFIKELNEFRMEMQNQIQARTDICD